MSNPATLRNDAMSLAREIVLRYDRALIHAKVRRFVINLAVTQVNYVPGVNSGL